MGKIDSKYQYTDIDIQMAEWKGQELGRNEFAARKAALEIALKFVHNPDLNEAIRAAEFILDFLRPPSPAPDSHKKSAIATIKFPFSW